MHTPRLIRSRAGFTLVESLIAVTFLAVLFLAVAQTSSRASSAFDEGSAEHMLSTTTHRALERIASAVEFGDASLLASIPAGDLGADVITFQTPSDFAGGVVTWTAVQIDLEREAGELDDGIDNDGDGLIDEGLAVLYENPGQPDERRIVLASGVARYLEGESANNLDDNGNGLKDEAGLSFSAEGNVVTIRLTCQRQDEGGRQITKTATTAVRVRNISGG